MPRWLVSIGVLPWALFLAARGEDAVDPAAFFEKKVRPALVEHCHDCHGPDSDAEGGLRLDSRAAILRGGRTGPAVRPGKPDESLLVDVINHGKLYQMPPKRKLPPMVIADLTAWVAMGAPWPGAEDRTDFAPEPAPASDPAAADDRPPLWSLAPVSDPEPPTVGEGKPLSPLDRFVFAKLAEAGIEPAALADKRTLLRRATFDLAGLPPTEEETEAFLADLSPGAFASLVDRLLASPRYGERWGRHWLDVARYADSNGMDENLAFVNAYRYRDYVIESFNADLPYDQFVREQIAGDLLVDPTDHERNVRRRIATGFLSLGPKMLAEDDAQKMEMDIIDEQVDTLGRTFMGLTLGCARCHDHKFDPIAMADYYGLAGIFKSTKTMENFSVVAVWHELPIPSREQAARREAHDRRLTQQRALITSLKEETNRTILEEARLRTGSYIRGAREWARQEGDLRSLRSRLQSPVDGSPAGLLELEAEDFARGNLAKDETNYGAGIGIVLNAGQAPNFAEYTVAIAQGGHYQVEIRYAAAESRPIRLLVNGKLVRADVAGATTGSWTPETQTWTVAGVVALVEGENTVRLERADGPIPHLDKIALFPWEGASADTNPIPKSLEQIADEFGVRAEFIVAWKRYLETEANQGKDLLGVWERIAGRPSGLEREAADPEEEALRRAILDPAGPFAMGVDPAGLYPMEKAEALKALVAEESRLAKSAPEIPTAMGVGEGTGQDLKIHLRGNHRALGAPAPRRFPVALDRGTGPAIADGASGRRELAQWLTDPAHPLTARVMVNRIWRWHFGVGLVRTPDNFGRLGDTPVHRDLLDWLARRFIESGWSVKAMHRLIMGSTTYQLGSTPGARSVAKDPENRLYGYFPRRRLEAEAVRDAILAVSGTLDTSMGGSLLAVGPREYVAGTASVDKTNYDSRRRSVYLPVIRSAVYEPFLAFDFPDPSAPNGDRSSTTLASQSLFLLNGAVVDEAIAALTDELAARFPDDRRARIERAYARALARRPTAAEVADAHAYIERARALVEREPSAVDGERLAWRSFCRVLFSSSEFLYLD